MKPFASVIREFRAWLTSFSSVRAVLPYHLHLLFGGVGILFLHDLFLQSLSFSNYNAFYTLFHRIPLYVLAYYGFFAGVWLTLISPNLKLLSYGLWAYAFVVLFPFEGLGLQQLVSALLYILAGYGVLRFSASSYSDTGNRSVN